MFVFCYAVYTRVFCECMCVGVCVCGVCVCVGVCVCGVCVGVCAFLCIPTWKHHVKHKNTVNVCNICILTV